MKYNPTHITLSAATLTLTCDLSFKPHGRKISCGIKYAEELYKSQGHDLIDIKLASISLDTLAAWIETLKLDLF